MWVKLSDQVGDYLRDLRKLLTKYGYGCSLYGHFGQDCIHTRIDFDLKTGEAPAEPGGNAARREPCPPMLSIC
jgi:hypothetical protein